MGGCSKCGGFSNAWLVADTLAENLESGTDDDSAFQEQVPHEIAAVREAINSFNTKFASAVSYN